MRHPLARLSADRRGATFIEYGLVAAFIVVALVASLPPLRQQAVGLVQGGEARAAVTRAFAR